MRELFLAMLAGESGYGYELKQSLQQRFGDLLPALNAGQIYSTLARLERDGLVVGRASPGTAEASASTSSPTPGARYCRSGSRRRCRAPAQGRVLHEARRRRVGAVSPSRKTLVDGQRHEYLQSLRDLDALLAANGKGVSAELLVEGAILHLKADLEWLDLIEQRLAVREELT